MRPELKNVTAREWVNALEKDGFKRTKKKGGHLLYYHQDGRRVAVSFHSSGNTFPIGTLNNMLKATRWIEEDLRRLKLIK